MRANLASEDLRKIQNAETERSNRAREYESHRSNAAMEQLRAFELDEQKRAHLVGEAQRAADLRLSWHEFGERKRANFMGELLRGRELSLRSDELGIRRDELAETIQSHREQEGLKRRELREKERATAFSEGLASQKNIREWIGTGSNIVKPVLDIVKLIGAAG